MNEDKVSVIVTTCKREPGIVIRALKSILNQTYDNLEVIVVDDSPSSYEYRDKLALDIKALDSSIKLIQHEKNKGACAARNTGLKNAIGKYIAYLDDDDEWCSEKIYKQVMKIKETNAALVYCRYYVINDETGNITESSEPLFKGMIYQHLILSNFIGSTSYPLINKEALCKIGGFDEKMDSAQDYDVWLRIAQNGLIEYIDECLVNYHIHDGVRISSNYTKKISGLERINKKNSDYILTHNEAFWHRHMILVTYYILNNQKMKAIKVWADSVIKCPLKIKGNLFYLLRILKIIE